jgi:regulatory protein
MNDELAKARKKAMDLLAGREHGRAELLRKVEKAGIEPEVAADALDQLQAEGLQSDRRYLESFVHSRINQGKGPVRIRAELAERGMSRGLVDEVLWEADPDWYAMAREARDRKFGPERPGDFAEKARQMRFLQYRGFEPDQIQDAVSATGE